MADAGSDEGSKNENPLPFSGHRGRFRGDYAHLLRSPLKRSKLEKDGELEQSSVAAAVSADCEVEVVETEEFAFLDGMTRLATLEADIEDVKRGLMSRQGISESVPFHLFHFWGDRVLSVTDIAGGTWCEVKVEYRKLHPHLKNSQEWKKMAEEGAPVVLRTATMKKGSEVHLKKELEVHEIVKVRSVTKEDKAAVQLINTFTQLSVIKTGAIEREIPVFGDPFERGVLVRGVIDQLQYCSDSQELILTDHKTRKSNYLPTTQQKKGTSLQLMLYKYLLDRMCLGMTKPELLFRHLNLDRDSQLTQGPLDHIQNCGLTSFFSSEESQLEGLKFGTVADCILESVSRLGLPLVGPLMVQYEQQSSGEILGLDTVEYDEGWMEAELERTLEYWEGARPAQGVDIETAWKCGSCHFREICTWRLKKELECSPVAKVSLP